MYNFEFVSVQDTLVSSDPTQLLYLLDNKKTDVIIVNWDSINTDPIYGCDKAYQFFNHYKPDLIQWVKNGGIIILEAQAASRKLVQTSYNIFTDNKHEIKVNEGVNYGQSATVNKKLKYVHPILFDLDDKLELPADGLYEKYDRLHPSKSNIPSVSASSDNQNKKRLYQGWFDNYSKDWEPLIFADSNCKKPVMLCRTVPNGKDVQSKIGAYIITTMYIAPLYSSGNSGKLIDNLLNFPNVIVRYQKILMERLNKKNRDNLLFFSIPFVILIVLIIHNPYQLYILIFTLGKSILGWSPLLSVGIALCALLFGPGILRKR